MKSAIEWRDDVTTEEVEELFTRSQRIFEAARPPTDAREDIALSMTALARAYVMACTAQGMQLEDAKRGLELVWINRVS